LKHSKFREIAQQKHATTCDEIGENFGEEKCTCMLSRYVYWKEERRDGVMKKLGTAKGGLYTHAR
jgi:hypothetical protein